MRELDFAVHGADLVPFSLTPMMAFAVGITESSGQRVDSVALQCQIQIEATRRPYVEREQEALLDLFGEPARWGRTLRTMLWTRVATMVPGFTGATVVDLQVPCSYDLTVAAAKYFFALDEGTVPLSFQFSGTVFYRNPDGDLQIGQISWTKEAEFRLPVVLWQRLMAEHYPDSAWICLRRDVFEQLYRLKARRGLATWEQAVAELLAAAEQGAPS